MVDMFFGPYDDTQALYVVKFGDHDTVMRIRYTGIHNEPPLANFEFEAKHYDVGEEVRFDGSYSEDSEGDELAFKWYFGDGGNSEEEIPTHTYSEPGAYKVTLIVSDSLNQLQQKTKTIQVGKPPTAKIISPKEGDQFYVGEILHLKGEAFYANGTAIMDSKLEWEVKKHHSDHFHPFLDPTFGNGFNLFAAPKPEDFYASLNSYLEIFLRVTDEDGLIAETNQIIQPTLVMVNVTSNIPGAKIVIEDEPITMPKEIWGWKEQEMYLKAENTPPILFKSWSDGVRDPERVATLNSSNPIFEAIFCVDDGGNCLVGSQTCCIGECTADGICSVPVKLPPLYVYTTLSPTMSSTTMSISDAPAPTPNPNGNNEQDPEASITSAGKAMLSITCLLIAGIIASFLYMWQYKYQTQITNPLPTVGNEKDFQNRASNASEQECSEDALVQSATSISSDDPTATV